MQCQLQTSDGLHTPRQATTACCSQLDVCATDIKAHVIDERHSRPEFRTTSDTRERERPHAVRKPDPTRRQGTGIAHQSNKQASLRRATNLPMQHTTAQNGTKAPFTDAAGAPINHHIPSSKCEYVTHCRRASTPSSMPNRGKSCGVLSAHVPAKKVTVFPTRASAILAHGPEGSDTCATSQAPHQPPHQAHACSQWQSRKPNI
jgi:hypothetical protein